MIHDSVQQSKSVFQPLSIEPNSKSPEWNKKEHSEAFTAIKRVYKAQSAFFDGLKESTAARTNLYIVCRVCRKYSDFLAFPHPAMTTAAAQIIGSHVRRIH